MRTGAPHWRQSRHVSFRAARWDAWAEQALAKEAAQPGTRRCWRDGARSFWMLCLTSVLWRYQSHLRHPRLQTRVPRSEIRDPRPGSVLVPHRSKARFFSFFFFFTKNGDVRSRALLFEGHMERLRLGLGRGRRHRAGRLRFRRAKLG